MRLMPQDLNTEESIKASDAIKDWPDRNDRKLQVHHTWMSIKMDKQQQETVEWTAVSL